jgi:hypothetical protein
MQERARIDKLADDRMGIAPSVILEQIPARRHGPACLGILVLDGDRNAI